MPRLNGEYIPGTSQKRAKHLTGAMAACRFIGNDEATMINHTQLLIGLLFVLQRTDGGPSNMLRSLFQIRGLRVTYGGGCAATEELS